MGTLFETHRDRIYRYVLHLLQDPAEAQDLTQETFLRAHRSCDSDTRTFALHLASRFAFLTN